MRKSFALGIGVAACVAASASGQAVLGFTGGSQFGIFYGGSTGDVVGFRFEVNEPITVTDLGVWAMDSTGGLSSDHQVGIWRNDTMELLTDNLVTPASTLIGDWRYEPTSPVLLEPGIGYTAGAMYTATDGDNYVSSPTTVDEAPEVTVINGVEPGVGSLGFVYPMATSTNRARFGPNFLFTTDGGCYPDCDESGTLDFFDFLCFQNAFAAGDPYADCDESGTLDFFDFLCFQNEFAAGCP
jgi:hypothetical protein